MKLPHSIFEWERILERIGDKTIQAQDRKIDSLIDKIELKQERSLNKLSEIVTGQKQNLQRKLNNFEHTDRNNN